jgi:hypothetical protein
MIDSCLEIIKPKRLYENCYASFSKDLVRLFFGTTMILTKTDFYWSEENTVTVKEAYQSEIPPTLLPNTNKESVRSFDNCLSFDINVTDAIYFSVMAGIGEDTWIEGKIEFRKNKVIFESLGFNHFNRFFIDTNIDEEFSLQVNWFVFYYFFKLFGKLTGKKTNKLLIDIDDDNVYFSDSNKEIVIKARKHENSTIYNNTVKYLVDEIYTKDQEIFKTEYANNCILSKQLTRPCEDILKLYTSKYVDRIISDKYESYIFKKKDK